MVTAKYTVVLKSLMDNPAAMAAINKALSTYPLFSAPGYDLVPTRDDLNRRLLNHYKYREIGFSAPGRFLDELETAMCEIMPRYNELLKTVVIMADLPSPFDNVDVVETFEQERTDRATGSGTSTAETNHTETDNASGTSTQTTYGKDIESDTPQNSLDVAARAIDSVDYASTAKWDTSETDTTSESESSRTTADTSSGSTTATNESTGKTTHTFTKKGNQGVNTYAHDMIEFRTAIIDVVSQIINDDRIKELFFQIY